MFKFKSYSVSKAEKKSNTGKNDSLSSSSSTGTLKKPSSTTTRQYVSPKTKTKPTANEIKTINNYRPVEYSAKVYPKKTVTKWHKNETFSTKKETEKVVILSPHKKLERK